MKNTRGITDSDRMNWLERRAGWGIQHLRCESDNDNQVQWWRAYDGSRWHEARTAREAIDKAISEERKQ